MVDDAHGVGVMGEKGRGTSEHFGLIDEVDLVMTTFSKSFASLGGFVVGDSKIIQYIKHHARALIFSASITPAALGAAHKALEIIQTEPWRRKRLWEITRIMNKELTAMGYHTGNTETPIIPVFIHDLEKTFMLWKFLRDYGIFTNPVIAPAVPPEDSLIRTSFTATHTDNDLDFILEGFKQGGKSLGLFNFTWPLARAILIRQVDISAVVVSFNSEKFLKQNFVSLFQQTIAFKQVIVVDNCFQR